ncbi:tetratricopeptide repeat protein [Paraburkholderia kururiensis]|uniref:Tetratricopeptide repeat protein n=1 Tax=Paraburkholderia kururiensis TaxID=984307 RepID=A0ABZ0WSG3_9BURK|nr:tetratricopeptide repeat protein [Paraburkholderia kururiensis]WQD80355.1 tetratricopeptide repeat protein [Paraburkholderia kururiensis]
MNYVSETLRRALALAAVALLGACAFKEQGYGVGAQAEREAKLQQASQPAPDTPGMYLGLIDRMQAQGLYYASLAHIDAYEKQYGASPESILLRADALRATGQPAASAEAYRQLLATPLAARGHRGLGLLAGGAGDFTRAAAELQEAVRLAPTDASTLSDLGYALLRSGDVTAARVPLMKAAELDQHNPKIVSNVVLFLVADGQNAEAQAVMKQQNVAPDVRAAIRSDAAKVAQASRLRQRAAARAHLSETGSAGHGDMGGVERAAAGENVPMASMQMGQSGQSGIDVAPRLLQRFSQ